MVSEGFELAVPPFFSSPLSGMGRLPCFSGQFGEKNAVPTIFRKRRARNFASCVERQAKPQSSTHLMRFSSAHAVVSPAIPPSTTSKDPGVRCSTRFSLAFTTVA